MIELQLRIRKLRRIEETCFGYQLSATSFQLSAFSHQLSAIKNQNQTDLSK